LSSLPHIRVAILDLDTLIPAEVGADTEVDDDALVEQRDVENGIGQEIFGALGRRWERTKTRSSRTSRTLLMTVWPKKYDP